MAAITIPRPVELPKEQAQTPRRSSEQRMEALRRANEIRFARAELKKDLKAGKVKVAEILSKPPPCAESAKVSDLLMALPNVGPVRTARLLRGRRISESKTVGGLSERQRAELVRALPQLVRPSGRDGAQG